MHKLQSSHPQYRNSPSTFFFPASKLEALSSPYPQPSPYSPTASSPFSHAAVSKTYSASRGYVSPTIYKTADNYYPSPDSPPDASKCVPLHPSQHPLKHTHSSGRIHTFLANLTIREPGPRLQLRQQLPTHAPQRIVVRLFKPALRSRRGVLFRRLVDFGSTSDPHAELVREPAGCWETFFFVVFVAVGFVGVADGFVGVLRADLDEALAVLRICPVGRLYGGS